MAAIVVLTTWLPKPRLAGVRVVANTPVPDNDVLCGVLLASSETVRVPLCEAVAVGVNVTLIVQLPPATSDVPQVLDCAKLPAAVIDEILRMMA